jgi:acetoin utilization deacetylase AcuC-like enzyme
MLKVAFHPNYVHPLPQNHRFPMEKYDLLPKQLLHEGTIEGTNLVEPTSIADPEIVSVHSASYYSKLCNLKLTSKEERITGFHHSLSLIDREKTIMEGTRLCAELALNTNAAMNIAGGTHHAFTNRGEGFCLLNDQAIAANWLLQEGKAKNILIIDLDVHQGNGTAEIFKDNPAVFTFSMHGKNNYPLHKEQSDLDVELEDHTSDNEFLYQLNRSIDEVMKQFIPDFIFYQCGVDVLASDKLGRLGMSLHGCKERDKIVFRTVNQLKVPIVCTMGGGYSQDIKTIIEAHANTFREIQNILF